MIEATIYKQGGKYKAVRVAGHAEYDEAGKDIICAAVSMLVINTANALEALTDNELSGSDDGKIYFEFQKDPDEKGELLIDTMLMGMKDVQKQYGNGYMKLIFEEV